MDLMTKAELALQKASWRELLESIQPNYGLTLGAGQSLKPDTFNEKARLYLHMAQREAHGRNWAKRKFDPPLVAIGFQEHPDTNLHLHIATWVHPDDRPMRRVILNGEPIWRKIRPSGDYWCRNLLTPTDYQNYITKDLWSRQSEESIFVYVGPGRRIDDGILI